MADSEIVVDRSRSADGRAAIGCGAVIGGMAGVGTFVAITVGGAAVGAVIGISFTLLSAVIVAAGIRSLWLGRVRGLPTLVLPAGRPICLGGVVPARFHRAGSRPATEASRLSAELICTESASYRDGTDDHTADREVYRGELPVRTDQVPGAVSGQVMIEVPPDAPPSLALSNNRVTWSVLVRVQTPGGSDDTGSFTVNIRPILTTGETGRGTVDRPGVAAAGERARLALDDGVVQCGDAVTGSVSWSGNDRRAQVAVALRYWTEGRGDADSAVVARVDLGSAEVGTGGFRLEVPVNGPVSYDGQLLRLRWQVAVQIPRPRRAESRGGQWAAVGVTVIPRREAPASPERPGRRDG